MKSLDTNQLKRQYVRLLQHRGVNDVPARKSKWGQRQRCGLMTHLLGMGEGNEAFMLQYFRMGLLLCMELR